MTSYLIKNAFSHMTYVGPAKEFHYLDLGPQ